MTSLLCNLPLSLYLLNYFYRVKYSHFSTWEGSGVAVGRSVQYQIHIWWRCVKQKQLILKQLSKNGIHKHWTVKSREMTTVADTLLTCKFQHFLQFSMSFWRPAVMTSTNPNACLMCFIYKNKWRIKLLTTIVNSDPCYVSLH